MTDVEVIHECEGERCGAELTEEDIEIGDYLCADCRHYYACEERSARYYDDHGDYAYADFADPGSGSALRAETPDNPRDQRCPDCGGRNRLTRLDRQLGYRCNECSDAAERGVDGPDHWEEDGYDEE